MNKIFPHGFFKGFLFVFNVPKFDFEMSRCRYFGIILLNVLWASWLCIWQEICKFLSFYYFKHFYYFFPSFFFFWYSHYVYITPFVTVPGFLAILFYLLHSFFFLFTFHFGRYPWAHWFFPCLYTIYWWAYQRHPLFLLQSFRFLAVSYDTLSSSFLLTLSICLTHRTVFSLWAFSILIKVIYVIGLIF